jgi:hypothetical protein
VTAVPNFRGAHVPRVLVSASSPKHFLRTASLTEDQKKSAKARAPLPAREARALPGVAQT